MREDFGKRPTTKLLNGVSWGARRERFLLLDGLSHRFICSVRGVVADRAIAVGHETSVTFTSISMPPPRESALNDFDRHVVANRDDRTRGGMVVRVRVAWIDSVPGADSDVLVSH
jgi:hypothetical protein